MQLHEHMAFCTDTVTLNHAKTKPVSFIYRSDRADGNPSRAQTPLKDLPTTLVLSLGFCHPLPSF